MSSSLYWERIKENPYDGALDDMLKYILRKKYDEPINTIVDESDIPYLEGLQDAGIKGAKELISAIKKYGKIHIEEIY